MRIGIDARSMFGTPTGVGRYLSNLLQHLCCLDHENTYCLYTDRVVQTPIIAQRNFQQKSLTLPCAQNYFTWNHFRLPPELLAHPVDLFHFPFYTMPLIRNYRSIVTIHDITYEVHPEWYSWKGFVATRYFSRYAAKHADTILTDSYATKHDLLTYYKIPEEKIVVIYLGVEPRFCQLIEQPILDNLRETYQIRASQVIVYIGSIHTRRNIEQLLRAFQRLSKTHSEVQLILAGKQEYPYLDISTLLDELALRENVILPGYIDDDDLPALYNLADIFIYPSSYEGFGLPPLEAMACGTPVITSNNSSLPEVTGDAALFVDPQNIEEMASAMHDVLSNRTLSAKMSRQGLIQAAKFSWENTARETLAVYNRN